MRMRRRLLPLFAGGGALALGLLALLARPHGDPGPMKAPASPAAHAPAEAPPPPSGLPRMRGFTLGWHPPKAPAAAATKFKHRHALAPANPRRIDLRPLDGPVLNQGPLGSCTAHGWASEIVFYFKNLPPAPLGFWGKVERVFTFGFLPRLKAPDWFLPSRLAFYWDERAIDGTTGSDVGAAVADGAKVAATIGVAPEQLWPYEVARFRQQPPRAYYTEAARHRLPEPASVDLTDLDEMRTCLAHGHPFVFGMTVYASFEGVGPDGAYIPAGRAIGGHCIKAVGYDDDRKVFLVKNSWGESWGDKGYFTMPYAIMTNPRIASDGWALADDAAPIVPAAATIPMPSPQRADDAAPPPPLKKAA